jgi:uncharacterized protein (DUF1501 family)
MQHASILTRRTFLQKTALLAAATGLSRVGILNARAQTTTSTDYKALVCVFMLGGNDGHNMLVPLNGAAHTAYLNARGTLAIPDQNTGVLAVSAKDGTPYGLNSGLSSLYPLWAQGKMAAIANMGMLVTPTTRPQYLGATVGLPTNLYSHSDQLISMQAGNPFGSGGTGWAGRVADATRNYNAAATFPPGISFAGPALFVSGNVVQSTSLIPGFDLTADGLAAWPASAAQAKSKALQEIVSFDSGLSLVQAANGVRADSIELNGMLTGLSGSPLQTVFPGTSIGQQMKQVAQIISLRGTTGMKRQVFFCALGGFDTHSSQSWAQWDLLTQLSDAMRALYDASVEMGIPDQVTSFTASEFGRSLQPSGTGTDHGWGNHQIIVGGAVQGGDLYGTFPDLSLGGPDDTGSRGVLIPSTSLDEFGATCAKWFGVSDLDMPTIFPNLGNFSHPNLGFLG